MKWNVLFGSLVLCVGLCTQGFGASLLDRMLGANGCGCASTSCCEPACGVANECCNNNACCEPVCGAAQTGCCDDGCNSCCRRRGLLDGLLGGHGCRSKCNSCCEPKCDAADNGCCEPACDPGCGAPTDCCDNGCRKSCCRKSLLDRLCSKSRCNSCCEPTCGHANNGCCEPACDPGCGAAAACCDTGCRKSCCRGSLRDALNRIFPCHRGCCKKSCCDNGCTSAYGSSSGAPVLQSEADNGGDIPPAPMVDPSAFLPSARIMKASSIR